MDDKIKDIIQEIREIRRILSYLKYITTYLFLGILFFVAIVYVKIFFISIIAIVVIVSHIINKIGIYFRKMITVNSIRESLKHFGYSQNTDTFTVINHDDIIREGRLRYYYEKGTLFAKYWLINYRLHGKYMMFYENGNLYEEGYFANNKKHGTIKQYFKNGKINWQGEYVNDKLNGKCIEYDERDGKAEYYYKNNEVDGEYKVFDDNGRIVEEKIYKYGEVIQDRMLNNSLDNERE